MFLIQKHKKEKLFKITHHQFEFLRNLRMCKLDYSSRYHMSILEKFLSGLCMEFLQELKYLRFLQLLLYYPQQNPFQAMNTVQKATFQFLQSPLILLTLIIKFLKMSIRELRMLPNQDFLKESVLRTTRLKSSLSISSKSLIRVVTSFTTMEAV